MRRSPYVRNRRAWREYNDRRKERASQIDPEKSRLAFTVIPYLLHHNHPDLPGYVEGGVSGIYLYEPEDISFDPIRKSFPAFNPRDLGSTLQVGRFPIHSLLLMGSIGAVAQTAASDYDYWVVYDESALTPEETAALARKLSAIETWAAGQRMEVHFFLSDIARTRANDFGATDKESSGSSQANILKEEFYRTAVQVAGKDLLWWVLPHGLSDAGYEREKEELLLEGYLDESDVVDLGNVVAAPEEEYFGAILWQFNKALASPYKSALKMALLESLKGDEASRLLCDILKARIQSEDETGEFDDDPYLLMMREIQGFYERRNMPEALATLEKCFFLKALDQPITDTVDHANLSYKERAIRAALREWKWSGADLRVMNGYRTWEFQQIAALANSLHNFMILLYKRINSEALADSRINALITDTDLTVIGRKLFTLYAKKDDKIEYLKRVKDENVAVDAVSFVVTEKRGGAPTWSVYKGNIISQIKRGLSVESQFLRRAADPVALMMWLTQNRIAARNTFFYLEPGSSPVSLADLQALAARLFALFPAVELADLDGRDMLSQAVVNRLLVAVNFASHRWVADLEKLHLVYTTNWGEAFCQQAEGTAGLQKLLATLTRTPANFSISDPNRFDIFVPKGERAIPLKAKLGEFLAARYNPLKRKAAE